MAAPKKITLVAGVSLVALVVLGAVAYATGLPPFEKRGEISADRVCGSLGDGEAAAAALPDALPEKSEYRFSGKDDLRNDESRDYFASNCFVWADGKPVLSVVAEMATSPSPDAWGEQVIKDESVPGEEGGRRADFPAGDKALATGRLAAVYVPCLSEGRVPGGPRHLSVIARAIAAPAASEEAARQSLADLAVIMARHAHTRAKCDLPPRLPATAPTL
ncbi:hypothetical protein KQY30_22825 [Streptomyces sp. GMY02]|uniref:hypothetical protein n=1 Tax=Streptomyces sp. GMY02 TaxID=1333528 RepID=UPI001C2C5D29|nr:hypothetical protein [Streptomyces sp. GMY02]QXE36632.1 hypothetical protein KQY30_22825 [Streptomyces sp. GMY02]